MKKTSLLLSIAISICVSFAQTSAPEFNFGFEKFSAGSDLPDGWFQWGAGYKLKIDTITKHDGRASVLIAPIGEKSSGNFGSVAYSIPSQYDAKEIEVRAYMKLENVTDGTIGLMIRVDGSSRVLGFENMMSKNIQGTRDWESYSVKIPFPEYAKTLYVGAILSGTGKLWVDDFKLFLDGKDIREAKAVPPREYKADKDKEFDKGSGINDITLTKSKVEDLDILGKTWGYLKYYHPSIALGDYNWDYELFRVLPKILNVKNPNERNSILDNWVKGLGNVEAVEKQNKDTVEIKLTPDLTWINEKALGPDLTKSLLKLKSAKRPDEHYYIGKFPGVGNPEFRNERPYDASMKYRYPDQGFRLLSLYRYWNMIGYYFPYKNLIGEDWNHVLSEFITKFISAGNELEYKLAALAIIARVHDTHANIWGMDYTLDEFKGERFSALKITFVENKAVVTDYYGKSLGEKTGLKIGDVIETVGGKKVDEIIKERLSLTPASNYPTQLRDIARSLLRSNDSLLSVTYHNGKGTQPAKLKTFRPMEIGVYSPKEDTCFKKLPNEIAYIYPGSIKNEYLPKIMDEVSKTKGLVIDFRCYPSDFIVFSLSEYLLPEPRKFVKFSICSDDSPGQFTMTNPLEVGRVNPDHYKGKVVIIINETTQSSAEYHTMAFRTAPGATVIGSTTAGADGNVSKIVLPGGIETMISGIGVYYPDGKETQRIGIVPDIEIRPTVKGIRDRRDELLEKAVEIIEKQ